MGVNPRSTRAARWIVRSLLVGAAACGPEREEPRPATDTGREPPPTFSPQPGLTEWGVQVCAAPELREELGPLERARFGPDWEHPPSLSGEGFAAGAGLVVEDFDGDGALDVFVTGGTSPCLLFRGDGQGHLVDETAARVPVPGRRCGAYGASAADVDRDGDMDLFVAKNGEPDRLWFNDGRGHFSLREGGVGLWAHGCGSRSGSWGDMDGDGDLDLFVSRHHVVWGAEDRCPEVAALPGTSIPGGDANSLYENQGDGTFREVSERLGDAGLHGYTFQGGWVDLDGDGNLDLYQVNDYGGVASPCLPLLGDGTGHFTPASPAAGLTFRADGMGLGIADLNEDGAPDLAVTDIDRLHLLISDGDGAWYNAAPSVGLEPRASSAQRASWGGELADLDNDGDVDFVTVFGPTEGFLLDEDTTPEQPDALFVQGDDGRFTDVGPDWGWSDVGVGRGLVVVDFNGDGWLDLFKADYRQGLPTAYLARCGAAAWLSIELEGAWSVHPWGARVEVDAGGQTHTRWMAPSSTSMASSGPASVHVGLGEHDHVDGMRVFWSDGSVSAFGPFRARQRVTVAHPDRGALSERGAATAPSSP